MTVISDTLKKSLWTFSKGKVCRTCKTKWIPMSKENDNVFKLIWDVEEDPEWRSKGFKQWSLELGGISKK